MEGMNDKFTMNELLELGFVIERDGGFEYLVTKFPTRQGYLVSKDFEDLLDPEIDPDTFTVGVYRIKDDPTIVPPLIREHVLELMDEIKI